jgi:hypothetical protein
MSGVNGSGQTDVKMISEALALSRPATSERASATACFSLVPYLHKDGPFASEGGRMFYVKVSVPVPVPVPVNSCASVSMYLCVIRS